MPSVRKWAKMETMTSARRRQDKSLHTLFRTVQFPFILITVGSGRRGDVCFFWPVIFEGLPQFLRSSTQYALSKAGHVISCFCRACSLWIHRSLRSLGRFERQLYSQAVRLILSLPLSSWEASSILLPVVGMLVHHKVIATYRIPLPSIWLAGNHLHSWAVEKSTVRVVSCPRTWHSEPGQGSHPDHLNPLGQLTSHNRASGRAFLFSKGKARERGWSTWRRAVPKPFISVNQG